MANTEPSTPSAPRRGDPGARLARGAAQAELGRGTRLHEADHAAVGDVDGQDLQHHVGRGPRPPCPEPPAEAAVHDTREPESGGDADDEEDDPGHRKADDPAQPTCPTFPVRRYGFAHPGAYATPTRASRVDRHATTPTRRAAVRGAARGIVTQPPRQSR